MKVKGKKNLAGERERGRAAIDAIFLPHIEAAMGPKFSLYQLKAAVASAGSDRLGNPDDILAKHSAMIEAIAQVEAYRQAAQSRIDAASSAAEISAIIENPTQAL